MRAIVNLALLALALAPRGAWADEPRALGRFGDWVAATHQEDGQTVCYAFTRAIIAPGDPGSDAIANRDEVVLSVTQRPSGRDDVAISAGFTLRRDQPFGLQVGTQSFDFYTAQRNAFARDGGAVAQALAHGGPASDHTTGPHAVPVADQFSLRGFPAAYDATTRACPES